MGHVSRIVLGGLEELSEAMCELCATRPAMKNDFVCEECSNRYSTLLRSARDRTSKVNLLSSKYEETILPAASNKGSNRTIEQLNIDKTPKMHRTMPSASKQESSTQLLQQPQAQVNERPEPDESRLETLQDLRDTNESLRVQLQRSKGLPSTMICYVLLLIGVLSLVSSILFSSNLLAFSGLGLTFWGALLFFVRPQSYVHTQLMNSTALSSLKAVEKIITEGIGYRERAVYIPVNGPEKVLAFIPSEPFSKIPKSSEIEGKTRLDDPPGLLVVPPGLALADLVESKLGFDLRNCGVETLVRTLPKVLVEDLEVARDVETEVKGDLVKFKLVDSIYAGFCRQVLDSSRRCGLGCPMCSALACILAIATGKPVLTEEEKSPPEGETTESYYQLVSGSRL